MTIDLGGTGIVAWYDHVFSRVVVSDWLLSKLSEIDVSDSPINGSLALKPSVVLMLSCHVHVNESLVVLLTTNICSA